MPNATKAQKSLMLIGSAIPNRDLRKAFLEAAKNLNASDPTELDAMKTRLASDIETSNLVPRVAAILIKLENAHLVSARKNKNSELTNG